MYGLKVYHFRIIKDLKMATTWDKDYLKVILVNFLGN